MKYKIKGTSSLLCFISLLMLTLCLSSCSDPDETENLPITEPEQSPDQEYLSYITIDEGYHVTNYSEQIGAQYQYKIYQLEGPDLEEEYRKAPYWEVIVLQETEILTILRQDLAESAEAILGTPKLIVEADVNFDGKNDILFWLGHFGNAGLIRYACYLDTNGEFQECPSFSNIPNPAINIEKGVILSSWRNSASSYGYAMYRLIDGEYIKTERLTEEVIPDEDGENTWVFTDEIRVNGQWQIRESFTTQDFGSDTLNQFYGEGCYWDITQDHWDTFLP